MTDVAGLGIRVTTHGAKEAARELNNLAKSAKESERASKSLAKNGAALEASLTKQAALFGKTGKAAEIRYDLERGAMRGLDAAQKSRILRMAEENDKMQRLASSAKKWGLALGVVGAAVIIGGVKAIIRATIEAESAQSKLEARVKSLGSFSAASAKHVSKLAESLQAISTFDDEAIKEAATSLLSFTNIRADKFDSALKATIDVAASTGDELASTAEKIGKALNNPITAFRTLRDLGIELTASQKGLIKELLQANKVSEAQDIILAELRKRYEGAAQAARNTLGGAIQGLKNDFDNLLEGDGKGVKGVTGSINELAEVMRSPEVKQGFSAVVSGILEIAEFAAKAIAAVGGLGTALIDLFSADANKSRLGLLSKRADIEDDLADLQAGGARGIRKFKLVLGGRSGEAFGGEEGLLAKRREIDKLLFPKIKPDFSNVINGSQLEHPADPIVGPPKPKKPRKTRGSRGLSENSVQNAKDRFDDLVGRFRSDLDGPLQRAEEEHIRRQREINQLAKEGKVGADDLAGALILEGNAYNKATEEIRANLDSQVASLSGPIAQAEDRHKQNLREIDKLTEQAGLSSEKVTELKAEEARSYDEATRAAKRMADPMAALIDDMQFELSLLGKTNAERNTAIQKRDLEARGISVNTEALRAQNEEYERGTDAIGDQTGAMDSIRDATKGFLDDIREGKNIWESLGSAIDRVADKLFDLAAENLMDQIFGKQGTTGAGSSGGNWLSGLLGAFFGGGGFDAGTTTFVAKGGAFDDGQKIKAYAKGGIFDSPTMFNMRSGLGVMGEDGPEAVLPLHRGPDGKLGVRMASNDDRPTQSQGDFHNTVVQNFNGQFTRRTAEQAARDQGRIARRGMSRTGG